MTGMFRIVNVRTVIFLVAAVLVVLGIDSGSIFLTKMSSADDVRNAGYAAAAVAQQGAPTQAMAVAALDAAQADADDHGIVVNRRNFEIYPGGTVRLTGTKTAGTLLLKYIPELAHLARVKTTLTVAPLPYDD
jgi:hypothetical protein